MAIKKLSIEQKKLYREKGIIPGDWWNYGINPVLGYRNNNFFRKGIYNNIHHEPAILKK